MVRWGNKRKPAFHLVQPGRVGRGVMDAEARPLRKPDSDLWMLVSSVVVNDEMHVEAFRDGGVQAAEEGEKLLVPVTRLAFGEHRAGSDVEGGKQGGGAVADIVVCDTFDVPQAHGKKQRLGAIQSLNLARLINASGTNRRRRAPSPRRTGRWSLKLRLRCGCSAKV
jgi:hypothetical protein